MPRPPVLHYILHSSGGFFVLSIGFEITRETSNEKLGAITPWVAACRETGTA